MPVASQMIDSGESARLQNRCAAQPKEWNRSIGNACSSLAYETKLLLVDNWLCPIRNSNMIGSPYVDKSL